MWNLPKYIKQKKIESDSFAILLYKLKDIGIFRNQTEHDYGIDLELELIENEMVTGKFIKIQVKSSEELNIRKADNVPTIGGIKQSTLRYWCELSYITKVFIIAVNIKDESLYVSRPLFWQCIKLIDDNEDITKTVELLPKFPKNKNKDAALANGLLYVFSHAPDLHEELYRYKHAFSMMKSFFSLYHDIFQYDFFLPIENIDIYDEFIECCKNIFFYRSKVPNPALEINEDDVKNIYNKAHWINKLKGHELFGDELTYQAVKPQIQYLFPMYLDELARFRKVILDSTYYWLTRNPGYHQYIYKYEVPTVREHDDIFEYDIDSHMPKDDWDLFIQPVFDKLKSVKKT
jgi:hypothetical protein